jgi:hypothetical protein
MSMKLRNMLHDFAELRVRAHTGLGSEKATSH